MFKINDIVVIHPRLVALHKAPHNVRVYTFNAGVLKEALQCFRDNEYMLGDTCSFLNSSDLNVKYKIKGIHKVNSSAYTKELFVVQVKSIDKGVRYYQDWWFRQEVLHRKAETFDEELEFLELG